MNGYDLEQLRHGVEQLRELRQRICNDAVSLSVCRACQQTLATYWDEKMHTPGDHLPGRMPQGAWLLRLCIEMLIEDVAPPESGVCNTCLEDHRRFLDYTQSFLAVKISSLFK